MKFLNKLLILSGCLLVTFSAACQKKKVHVVSDKTGWTQGDPYQKFLDENRGNGLKCPKGMVLVPEGAYVRVENNEVHNVPLSKRDRSMAFSGFYMDAHEVTNANWREYLTWVQSVYKYDLNRILKAIPNNKVWIEGLHPNQAYLDGYFLSPEFNDYPVVGVSWDQANDYCSWRTDRLNEVELIKKGIIPYLPYELSAELIKNNPDSAYCFAFSTKSAANYVYYVLNHYKDWSEYPELADFTPNMKYDINKNNSFELEECKILVDAFSYGAECRLPTEAEWEYAAYALSMENGLYKDANMYPWKGNQLRNTSRGKKDPAYRANCMLNSSTYVGLMVNNSLTVPVNYFGPNDFGLYNMAGNVNEWVLDSYDEGFVVDDKPSADLVNVQADSLYVENLIARYFYNVKASDRDSIRNVLMKKAGVKLADKELASKDVDEFVDSDEYSEDDGDYIDVLDVDFNDPGLSVELTALDKAVVQSPNNKIYKGGSWCDRLMWLNPAKRRALLQTESRNDIGFRCVMNAAGREKRK